MSQAIDVLLANGAVLNYYNPRSEVGTALYAACMQGHPSSAAKLLKAGAAMLAQVSRARFVWLSSRGRTSFTISLLLGRFRPTSRCRRSL